MTRPARSRGLYGVLVVLLLSASACAEPSVTTVADPTAHETTMDSTATTETPQVPTTQAQVVDQIGYFRDLIDDSYAHGGMAIRGWILALDAGRARVKVADVVADWSDARAAPPGQTAEFPLGRDWLQEALAAALPNGEIPALLLTEGGDLVAVAVLGDDLRTFRRDPNRELPPEIRIGAWIAMAIDEGSLEVQATARVDPSRPLSCQTPTDPAVVAFSAPDGDEVVGAIRFAEAALAGLESSARTQELQALATEIAAQHSSLDPLTGMYNAPWSSDIYDQLARGIPPDQVELLPTLFVYLDPGNLTWLAAGGEVVLFVDTKTKRLLSWIDYYSYVGNSEKPEPGWLEVMLPPEGDLGVFLGPIEGTFTCTEQLREPYMVLPRGDLTVKRWVISLDDGQAMEWRGQTEE